MPDQYVRVARFTRDEFLWSGVGICARHDWQRHLEQRFCTPRGIPESLTFFAQLHCEPLPSVVYAKRGSQKLEIWFEPSALVNCDGIVPFAFEFHLAECLSN